MTRVPVTGGTGVRVVVRGGPEGLDLTDAARNARVAPGAPGRRAYRGTCRGPDPTFRP